ncbi:MAG: hypothetical protein WBP85_15865 [Terracidiphilus sp.]
MAPPVAPPMAPPFAPMPGLEYEVPRYAGKIRVLGILWLIYAGVSFLAGIAGLTFLRGFLAGGFGPWANGHPMFPGWFGPAIIHFAWLMLSARVIVCAIAGWGLLEHAHWGRIMAIIAAVICLLKIPFGTALGVATLIILLGYRNSTLYDHL